MSSSKRVVQNPENPHIPGNFGLQTEKGDDPLAAAAVAEASAILANAERAASGIVLDAIARIVLGLELAATEASADEAPPAREAVLSRLFVADADRRQNRAEFLRRLADALDGDTPPTIEDLEGCLPDAWGDRLAELEVASAAREHMDAIDPITLRDARMRIEHARVGGRLPILLARLRALRDSVHRHRK